MPDPTRVVIVTLVPVGPRVAREQQWFAVSVSAGLRYDEALTPDVAERSRPLLQPWNWGWADHAHVKAFARATDPGSPWLEATVAAPESGRVVERAYPPLADGMLPFVQAWVDKANAPELRLMPPESTTSRARAEAPTFAEQLANLATYPGDLPQQLGLVSYVKLTFPPELDGKDIEIAIAPTIVDPAGTLKVVRTSDLLNLVYDTAGSIVTELRFEPLAIKKVVTHGSLGPDPSAAWVRIENKDAAWSEQLDVGCNAVVDLVARIAHALDDVPIDDASAATELLRAALRFYVPLDPWPTLEALLSLDGAKPIPVAHPVVNWAEVIRRGAGTSAADLAAAPSADVLWWLWQWAPHQAETTTPTLLTLQHGRVDPLAGPGTKRRHEARKLAGKIVEATRDGTTPYDAAVKESTAWLREAAADLRARLEMHAGPAHVWLDAPWGHAIDKVVPGLWQMLSPAPSRPLPVLKPHGITVQLDEVTLEGEAGDADLWKALSGIALFVKREGGGTWKLVNGATVRTRDADDKPIKEWRALYKAPAIVPTGLPFHNGVRSPFVTYEHRSLVAHSALEAGGAARAMAPPAMHAHIVYTRPVIKNDAAPPAMLLPQLRYGEKYSMAVACFDLGGGAPAALCDGVPWRVRADYSLDAEPTHKVESIEYLRATPVGQVRFTRTDQSSWPDVPANVYPLARELPKPKPEKGETHESDPMLVVTRWDRGLTAADPILKMRVKAPAVDVDVIERTVGVALAKPARAYLQDHQNTSQRPGDNPAHAFDDPAVTKLWIKVERLKEVATDAWEMLGQQTIELPKAENYVSDGISIACWFADTTTIAKDKITLAVPTAQLPEDKALSAVFRIELSAWISKDDAKRFKTGVLGKPKADGSCVLPGHVLLVERASKLMPTDTELASWFKLRDPDKARRELDLYVEAPAANAGVLANIKTAEVLRHVWRWAGRPRMRWPESWPTTTTKVDRTQPRYREWEETAFIDLDPKNDSVPAETLCIPVGRFVYGTDAEAPTLLHESWAADQAAHYVRYVLRVQSRYVGMWRGDKSPDTVMGREAVQDGDQTLRIPAWLAAYLPPRPATPRVPVIRGILPLTNTDQAKAPGIMVVLDEPMFRDHGISEGLVAQIDVAYDYPPTPEKPEPVPVLEYGHDPIITPDVPVGLPTKPVELDLFGPYGITLDTDDNPTPLFGASCYLLKPPFTNPERIHPSEPWDFARVRFRRVLHDHCQAPPAGREEEWTRSYWVQFVAPSNTLAPSQAILDNKIVKGLPYAAAGFSLYAVVTGQIRAYHGGAGDELYLDAFPVENGQGTLQNDRPDLELSIRVCEIQRTTPVAGETPPIDLWEMLFPTESNGRPSDRDAWARITRISPPQPIQRR